MSDKKPDAKFRAGTISATVWTNQATGKDGQPRTFSSVSFEKSYKDKDGAWKTTKSLNKQDVPKAVVVLQKAYEYLALSDLTEEEQSEPEGSDVHANARVRVEPHITEEAV